MIISRRKRTRFPLIMTLVLMGWVLSACVPPAAFNTLFQAGHETSQLVQEYSSLDSPGLLVRHVPASNQYELAAINLQDGSSVTGMEPIEIGYEFNYALSPDRRQLAMAGKRSGCRNSCLQVVDLDGWQVTVEMELEFLPHVKNWIGGILFDPTGQRLLLISSHPSRPQSTMVLLNLDTKEVIQQAEMPAFYYEAEFTSSGDQIIMIASDGPSSTGHSATEPAQLRAFLFDADSLELLWDQPVQDTTYGMYSRDGTQDFESMIFIQPAVVMDADRNRVWIAHAAEDRLTLIDFEQQQMRTSAVREPQSWIDQLIESLLSLGVQPVQAKVANMMSRSGVLSPDGKELYVISHRSEMVKDGDEWKSEQEMSGLQVWNLEKSTLEYTLDSQASVIRSALGKVLLIHWQPTSDSTESVPVTQIFDPDQKKVVAALDGVDMFPTFDQNGDTLLVASDYTTGKGSQTILDEDFGRRYQWQDKNSFWLWARE
jgi:hypothetical protein